MESRHAGPVGIDEANARAGLEVAEWSPFHSGVCRRWTVNVDGEQSTRRDSRQRPALFTMAATSKIEWTDRTWNPVRGCSVISPGCVNCYAMKQAHRFSGSGRPTPRPGFEPAYFGLTKLTKAGPQWTGVIRTIESALLEPLSWRKPARVFVNSMSDLFHEDVPDAFVDRVFAVMALASQHTFQILTKRPRRMRSYVTSRTDGDDCIAAIYQSAYSVTEDNNAGRRIAEGPWPLPNVWIGTSVENQKYADERIPQLLQTPAAVRFISYEPALGPVGIPRIYLAPRDSRLAPYIHWVIVGGESGPGARPFDLAWARSIVQQCEAAGVPVFVKQLGALPYDGEAIEPTGRFRTDPETGRRQMEATATRIPLRDRKGGDMAEWPDDLRVRQFPEART